MLIPLNKVSSGRILHSHQIRPNVFYYSNFKHESVSRSGGYIRLSIHYVVVTLHEQKYHRTVWVEGTLKIT